MTITFIRRSFVPGAAFFCFLAGEKNAVLRGIFPAGYLQMRPNAGIIYRVYPKADGPGRAAF